MAQEGFKRKLTAILSADAVGYSRLMLDDEGDTVRTISSYRNEITDLVRQHSGKGEHYRFVNKVIVFIEAS